VQVHPTGLVHPDEPDAKVKFLAAEALRGTGGLLLDANGKRFADELGRRDYVTGEMWKGKGPFRLVLNSASSKEIEWHCKHYQGRGLMKKFNSSAELAKEIGVSPDVIKTTFEEYNKNAKDGKDQFGKKYFQNVPYRPDDYFYVAIVCPVVHYCMGGLRVSPATEVETPGGKPVPGLWAAGEVMGGTHGLNRLGGSSLLDCVVFGRVSGVEASRYLLQNLIKSDSKAYGRLSNVTGHLGSGKTVVSVDPSSKRVTIDINWEGGSSVATPSSESSSASSSTTSTEEESEDVKLLKAEAAAKTGGESSPSSAPAAKSSKDTVYTLEEVAKHNTEKDCWVVVNGQVLNVTKFLPEHPGGAKAILLFAGKDASDEFNMLHKPEVIPKYAPDAIIGKIASGSSTKH
jgi:cytochrome b involved in lipid metabolism